VEDKDVLLQHAIDRLDHEGRTLLERGADFDQKGIKRIQPSPLFYPQRHQNERKQQKGDNKSGEGIFSKEEKVTNPHQFSVLDGHAVKQVFIVQDHSRTQNNR